MPPKTSLSSRLPESFLEAVAEHRLDPLILSRVDGFRVALPFVAGAAPGNGTEGAGDTDPAGGSEADKDPEGGSAGGDSTEDPEDGDEDPEGDTEGLPENVKEILRKNRKEARDARKAKEKAEREAAEARTKAKEYEDRDKTELERAKEQAAAAEKEAEELRKSNKMLTLRTAFLADSSFEWQDPEDALEMAMRKYGLDELEISDAGTVSDKKALKSIIKEMAREKAYLVKGKQDGANQGKGASGDSMNSGNAGRAKPTNAEKLALKYPAMSGRRKKTTE